MRGRPLLAQAAIAAGAVVLAAVVWLRPPKQGNPGDVPVAALRRGEVKAIHWDDGSHRVDVTRAIDSDRPVWVRIATSPTLLAPDGGTIADAGIATDAGTARPDAGPATRDLHADAGVHARGDAAKQQ